MKFCIYKTSIPIMYLKIVYSRWKLGNTFLVGRILCLLYFNYSALKVLFNTANLKFVVSLSRFLNYNVRDDLNCSRQDSHENTTRGRNLLQTDRWKRILQIIKLVM